MAIALLVLAFTAEQLSASEVFTNAPQEKNASQTDHIAQMGGMVKTIQVGLLIEIPASGLLFRHHLSVPIGTTVSQALETAYTVKHGVVCCDSRDIWAINGLAVDPYKEKWWIIKVNGNTQNTSSTRKLVDGDIVELVYMENALNPVAHIRLEDWIENKGRNK